jgi:sulfide:quinone oxidoreductase
MNTVQKLADDFLMTTQLEPGDIPDISERGVNTIINLRPDDEGEGQPPSDDIAIAAARNGIDYHHIPIKPGQVEDHHVDSFAAIMEEAGRPVLCSCGSGKRVTAVWALYEAERTDVDSILEQTAACGYDLSGIKERLSARQPQT